MVRIAMAILACWDSSVCLSDGVGTRLTMSTEVNAINAIEKIGSRKNALPNSKSSRRGSSMTHAAAGVGRPVKYGKEWVAPSSRAAWTLNRAKRMALQAQKISAAIQPASPIFQRLQV